MALQVRFYRSHLLTDSFHLNRKAMAAKAVAYPMIIERWLDPILNPANVAHVVHLSTQISLIVKFHPDGDPLPIMKPKNRQGFNSQNFPFWT